MNGLVLAGKRALVTGASSGLGAHFAIVLAGAGAEVVCAARRRQVLETLVDEIGAAGGAARAVELDVTDSSSVRAVLDVVGPLDILVNNAGVANTKAVFDQTEADYDQIVDTNLKGSYLMAVECARRMSDRGAGGSIINIASLLGLRQGGRATPYAISKAGVVQLTKQLALELARYGIRVNAIAPGYFATDMNVELFATEAGHALIQRIPSRRLGEKSELDGPLLLLASDASSYMTGSVLAVDGGHLVSSI